MNHLSDWLSYLETLHPVTVDLGLDRVRLVATALSLTRFKAAVIMVGGTNGKGSTVKTLENIFLQGGYQVAAYTSPHLLQFNERLRINGISIDDEKLMTAFSIIEKARLNTPLTYFEFTTLAILWICQQLPLDILILEIGLGGRLDAVNIVEPDVSIITNIDLDHMEYLGDDRESIGYEKAGIIRHQKPIVCGDRNPPDSLMKIAQEKQAQFFYLGKDFDYEIAEEKKWHWRGDKIEYKHLPYPQLILDNVATALAAIEQLTQSKNIRISLPAIEQGISQAFLPGRFEMVSSKPTIILDVAHNPAGMKMLAQRLKAEYKDHRIKVIFSMLSDKNIADSVRELIPVAHSWYVVGLAMPRGSSAPDLQQIVTEQGAKICYAFAIIQDALISVISSSKPDDCIIITGSFYTVAWSKMFLQESGINL